MYNASPKQFWSVPPQKRSIVGLVAVIITAVEVLVLIIAVVF